MLAELEFFVSLRCVHFKQRFKRRLLQALQVLGSIFEQGDKLFQLSLQRRPKRQALALASVTKHGLPLGQLVLLLLRKLRVAAAHEVLAELEFLVIFHGVCFKQSFKRRLLQALQVLGSIFEQGDKLFQLSLQRRPKRQALALASVTKHGLPLGQLVLLLLRKLRVAAAHEVLAELEFLVIFHGVCFKQSFKRRLLQALQVLGSIFEQGDKLFQLSLQRRPKRQALALASVTKHGLPLGQLVLLLLRKLRVAAAHEVLAELEFLVIFHGVCFKQSFKRRLLQALQVLGSIFEQGDKLFQLSLQRRPKRQALALASVTKHGLPLGQLVLLLLRKLWDAAAHEILTELEVSILFYCVHFKASF